MAKEEKKDEMKNRISLALKDPILQQGFEIICKENAELRKELKKWKDEWQEQVQKVIDEGYARTLQTMQLTKAKELLELFVQWNYGCCKKPDYKNLVKQAEQFLNSELQSKWINPARTTNDNKIKLNSEVEK